MSRRLWSVLVLAMLAIPAVGKPPELPQDLKITVKPGPAGTLMLSIHPFQVIEGWHFQDDCPVPTCPHVPTDRRARAVIDPGATRSVLENLDTLIKAGEILEKARGHAKAGDRGQTLACVSRVRELAPGSTLSEDCDEVVAEAVACVFHSGCGPAGCEEAAEEKEPCCCPMACFLGKVSQRVHCWMSQTSESRPAREARCVMVDGLLKAAHLAMGDGRIEKARELVRQAHALDAARVESDPLVYKMHLLPAKNAAGSEERCEPLPAHPKQKKPTAQKAAPNFPGIAPDFIEAMEGALKGVEG